MTGPSPLVVGVGVCHDHAALPGRSRTGRYRFVITVFPGGVTWEYRVTVSRSGEDRYLNGFQFVTVCGYAATGHH